MECEEVDIQSVRFLSSQGGVLKSTACPDLQVFLPQGALTIGEKSFCRVSVQVITSDPSFVQQHLGSDACMSVIIMVEPVRRRFHKNMHITVPLPRFNSKKVDARRINLLFSIGGHNSDWHDITSSFSEKLLDKAVETGGVDVDISLTGKLAIVVCASSIIDIPATIFEMMKSCMDGGSYSNYNNNPSLDLLRIAKTGDVAVLKEFLSNGDVDVNCQNKAMQTALHLACMLGHKQIVEELLDAGADFSLYSKNGNTAIHLASYYGHVDIVQVLLDKGCDVNMPSRDLGCPPIYPAILEMHCDVVRLLLERGTDITYITQDGLSLLLVAVHSTYNKVKTTAMLNLLLQEVNLQQLSSLKIRGFNCHNEALLHCISTRHSAKDLTVNLRQKLVSLSKELLNDVMSSAQKCTDEMKGLFEAIRDGNSVRVENMLEEKDRCIDVLNARTELEVTALHCACCYGHTSIAKKLIGSGSDVNRQARGGFTCLYIAVAGGYKDIANALLLARARTDIINEFGLTAVDLATESGRVDIAELIQNSVLKDENRKSKEAKADENQIVLDNTIALEKFEIDDGEDKTYSCCGFI